ncbi:MAG: hypothetical protein GY862_14500 [Gammaproteobacteria bacterium]|nr:hypothetical protein [Gammaproteobacteria bacterium]
MRLYRDQWRVSGIVLKMPSIDEVRGECRAWIVALVRFVREGERTLPGSCDLN